MTRHEQGNEGDGGAGDRDCKRPTNPADRNGVAAHLVDVIFGCRRGDLLDGGAAPGSACGGVSDQLRSGEDEDPVFDGGDEDPLYRPGDADRPGGEVGEHGDSGSSDPVRLRSNGTELVYSFDDDADPRWGTRHADECALDFLGGDARVSFLGDGEDLP